MVLLGAALTAANKPMYAACGAVHAALGATSCLYWIAFAKVGLASSSDVDCSCGVGVPGQACGPHTVGLLC